MVFPDTLVGTDSHTTMINGLGVVGWGVGGIEAEAAMLGQPTVMLVPQVVGFRLHGALREGATATDLVLTVTADAAQEGRGREVRRVLRPRPREPVARRPRHHRQHGARVRRHHRLLPGRRRDARLPAAHRPRSRPRRAGRGVLQGRRASSAPSDTPDAGVQRHARARPGDGGAEPRRPEAPAGPRPAAHREGVVEGGAGRLRGRASPRPRRPRCRSR